MAKSAVSSQATPRPSSAVTSTNIKIQVPHIYLNDEVVVDKVLKYVTESKGLYHFIFRLGSRCGVDGLSFEQVVLKVATGALREVPEMNSVFADSLMQLKVAEVSLQV